MTSQSLITIKQAEALTGQSDSTIRRRIKDGSLTKQVIEGAIHLDRQQVIQVLGLARQTDSQPMQDDQPPPSQPPAQPTQLVTQDSQVTMQVVDALTMQLSEKDTQIRQLHTLLNQQNIINANLTKQLKQVTKQPKQLPAPKKKTFWERWFS